MTNTFSLCGGMKPMPSLQLNLLMLTAKYDMQTASLNDSSTSDD